MTSLSFRWHAIDKVGCAVKGIGTATDYATNLSLGHLRFLQVISQVSQPESTLGLEAYWVYAVNMGHTLTSIYCDSFRSGLVHVSSDSPPKAGSTT